MIRSGVYSLASVIQVGELHEITLQSGRKEQVYIAKVTEHVYTYSFLGWNWENNAKVGRYYWIGTRDWDSVIDIKLII